MFKYICGCFVSVGTKISPEFYLQFWALKVSDLDVNERLYDENIKELDTAIAKLERRSASASVGSVCVVFWCTRFSTVSFRFVLRI